MFKSSLLIYNTEKVFIKPSSGVNESASKQVEKRVLAFSEKREKKAGAR